MVKNISWLITGKEKHTAIIPRKWWVFYKWLLERILPLESKSAPWKRDPRVALPQTLTCVQSLIEVDQPSSTPLCLWPESTGLFLTVAAKSLQSSDSVRPDRRQPTRLPCPWDSPGKNTGVGCHFLLQCMEVKSESEVAQLCPTLRDPMDCSLPGSSVHGIFQAFFFTHFFLVIITWYLPRASQRIYHFEEKHLSN